MYIRISIDRERRSRNSFWKGKEKKKRNFAALDRMNEWEFTVIGIEIAIGLASLIPSH